MKKKVQQLIKHPLIYGSGILMVGGVAANFFNFLFNLFMSRNLSIAEYGVLASIIALISFPNLVVSAVIPLIVHFAGNYFAKGKLEMVRGLYFKIIKFLFLIGIGVLILFLINIPQISHFFHISNITILFVTGAIIFFAFISVINMALLQAKLAFGPQIFITMLGTISKLVFGVGFVLSGFGATGAVFALFLSAVSSYVASFLPLKFIFQRQISSPNIKAKELFSYGLPSALTLIGLTSFISADIMLVKHFFSPTAAGIYAGLSLVGRVIFYLSAPIASVMFPLIVQKHSRKENFSTTFKLSLLFVFVPSMLLTSFYFFFPEFTIVFFLKRSEYLVMSPLLWLFGVFISLYCLLTIISNFYLSIKKTKIFIPIVIGAILQIILICFYHNSFLEIISISITITFLLVCILLLYYPYATKR